ncbi:hypothetical protein RCC89_05095 [Cytophagaceae bacterium ABcell3]|nr:hypothetical protein RCC89_05095 [Cytophagaceae bacterium ABcell3]
MRRFIFLWLFVWLSICIRSMTSYGQSVGEQRIKQLEMQLQEIALHNKGLNEKVDFSVYGASIQDFLMGLAEANDLNINVDPSIGFKIYNNFKNEKVINILLFLAKEYNLDIDITGSILSFHPYNAPIDPKSSFREKEIKVKYNAYNNNLTLDLKGDSLYRVVKKISQESKKNIILSSGLNDRLVTVYIQEASFDNAIQKMVLANSLKVVKTEDNFYIIKTLEDGDDVEVTASAKKATSLFNNPFPPMDPKKAKKTEGAGDVLVDVQADSLNMPLISVEALNVPIFETLKTVAAASGVSYFLFSEIKGNSTLRVLNVDFDSFLKKLLQGSEYTYKTQNGLYLIGERKLEGLRAHKVIQLQYRSAKDISQLIPAEIKHGVDIKEFIELNSMLLTGSQPQIEEIEAFIHSIDRVVPMVLIDVLIMDVRKNKSISTGLQAGLSDSVRTGGKLFPGIDFSFSSRTINEFLDIVGANNTVNLGRVTPDFYVKLKALEDNSNVEVRSTPKLSTLNGHKATLSIGSTRYYSITTQNVMGSMTPQTVVTKQYQSVQANLAITILPVVAGDDQVTLEIDVNNSDFIQILDDQPPPSASSQFNSMIRVRNEEMIVLGGLERYERSDGGSGVPILSRIPILKWLFSARSNSKSKTVTLVFIKPNIIY